MLSKVKRLYDAVKAWTEQTINPLELELLECNLSPIEKHIVYSGITNKVGLFHQSYDGWRVKRCNKMLEIYGIDYFKNKKILELGAGHGDIGAFFAELGAQVLCLDGRIQNVNFGRLKHRKIEQIKFEQFNLESDFSLFGRFDLIIDFGLIYHLKNVEAHLKCCFATADDIIMETVVCDSTDPHKIFFLTERKEIDEESLEGTGSRPSPFYIERIAKENNFDFTRYFTPDLNYTYQFSYDWEHRNDNRISENFILRRFWRLQKSITSVSPKLG
jgi:SAM-dependent methyltransferase